ncbi:MAG TPA: hypothetical protein VKD90_22320 [Gemmataceae bacterium]|nr:hypothetical protein [Gemmataceae bacterium]
MRGNHRLRGPRRRLWLERLEDKTVPASYTAATLPELIADINAANQTIEADTITLVARTTFTLTAVDNTTDGANGLPVIAAGEDLTIIGNGDAIERNTKVAPAFRLFDIAASATLTLQNVTLQGGLSAGFGAAARGGAVYSLGSLTLNGVTVRNNAARGDQGMNGFLGGPIPGGTAAGGGVYSEGNLTVVGSSIHNNVATGGRGADGFLAYADGTYPVGPGPAGGALGGGLCVAGGSATITGSTIASNSAQGGAGGAGTAGSGGSGPGAYPSTAGAPGGNGLGGGVYVAASAVTIRTTTVTHNIAQGGRGGQGGGGSPNGGPGQGIGGGLFIDPTGIFGMDAYTVSHVKSNHASTSDNDVRGTYAVIP